ncbi:membrane protein [Clostridium punense]|uniref:Membrane protein n=1 Tax=Clostridium punense TaxID=1054297 RepID=A0ABS4K2I6_9CLOT|nr:YihY/virulence factor BrkB family protein [Clostridium punense]MBP2021997.1 membrane protein [Clostridium punense]
MRLTQYIIKMILRYKHHNVSALASQMAFDMMFAFFPFLIFLLTMVGFTKVNPNEVLGTLASLMPSELYVSVSTLTLQLLQTRNTNLLSISLIFSLYTASRGFRAIMYGLNEAYEEKETRSFIKVIFISVVFMIGVSLVIIFLLLFLVFGEMIGNYLIGWMGLDGNIIRYVQLIRYPIGFLGMIVVFTALYYYIPCKRLRWLEVMPGAIFTSFLWIVLSMLFAYYVNNYGNYSAIYGSIGAIIILMLWLQITSTTILLGGELNALLAHDKELRYRLSENKR